MNGMNLEALGFTREEIEQKVIERIVDQVMRGYAVDEDGDEYPTGSKFAQKLMKAVTEAIDQAVAAIAEKHILPSVGDYVEKVTFQETNRWGEPKKEPLTFKEYLALKAENYLTEQVSYDGKSKSEDSYSWKGTQTRITHMVNQHLHFTIKHVMEDAVKGANEKIVAGIEQTVKLKLKEISDTLSVDVKTR